MTTRHVKIAISVLWYSADAVWRGLNRLAGRTPTARLVVLYYHEVPDVSRPRFARQMAALSRMTVVRAAHASALPDGSKNVAITFDDAFRSVRTNALPELLSRGLPATIFAPVDFLGKRPGWEMRSQVNDVVMTSEELRSLPGVIEVGSHSLSHPHLTQIDAAHLREEITRSREALTEAVGSAVSLLAFPYGDYDDRVVSVCMQAGYERVFGIDPRLVDPAGGDFVRGRVGVDPQDGLLVFFLKARGAYRWMTHASAIKRQVGRWRRPR